MTQPDARAAASLFDKDRLRVARQLRRLRRVDLAAHAGVTAAAISQYESGAARPRPATLAALAFQLGMPLGFFASTGRPLPALDTGQGFFRSLRRTAQIDRDAALAEAAVLADLVAMIETRVLLPPLALPEDMTLAPTAALEEVEAIATEVRKRFDLGDEPVPNVVRTLERHGAIVGRLPLANTVDAFSWPVPSRPLVILGTDKGNRARSRFDAAHELGHLVLHYSDPEPGNQHLERQAHRFASAFLMPAAAMRDEFPVGRLEWTPLVGMKQRWQVSLQALLYRARDLELLTRNAYESAMKQMSRRGWRVREPGDLGPPEQPRLLRKAVELLASADVPIEELAAQVALPLEKFEELVGGAGAGERPVVAV